MSKSIIYKTTFKPSYQYCKRHYPNFVSNYLSAINIFLLDRSNSGDHALKGKLSKFRAFWVTNDIRVVYKESKRSFEFHRVVYKESKRSFEFHLVGTHEMVY